MGERYPVTVPMRRRDARLRPRELRRRALVKILVCVKRVPMTGGTIVLTADEQAIETRHLGFTISPHEECGVEEAVRLVEAAGGRVGRAHRRAAGGRRAAAGLRWRSASTARSTSRPTARNGIRRRRAAAIVAAIARRGGHGALRPGAARQRVGRLGRLPGRLRVAHLLGRPCVTGIKALAVEDGEVRCEQEGRRARRLPPAAARGGDGARGPEPAPLPVGARALRARRKPVSGGAPCAPRLAARARAPGRPRRQGEAGRGAR